MSARGMAGDINFRRITAIAENISVDPSDGRARLADNVRDGYGRTEIVLDEHNQGAAFGEYRNEVAVILFAAATPIAAVNIDQHRATGLICRVNIQLLTRRTAVRHPQPGFRVFAYPARPFGALFRQLRILRDGFAWIILIFQFLRAKPSIAALTHVCPFHESD